MSNSAVVLTHRPHNEAGKWFETSCGPALIKNHLHAKADEFTTLTPIGAKAVFPPITNERVFYLLYLLFDRGGTQTTIELFILSSFHSTPFLYKKSCPTATIATSLLLYPKKSPAALPDFHILGDQVGRVPEIICMRS